MDRTDSGFPPVMHLGVEPVWTNVRRIAVLRGGGLGDLLFVIPALEALDAAYPRAESVPRFAQLLAG